ncbi:putative LRR containing protein, partial [Trachipleistophora hominis]
VPFFKKLYQKVMGLNIIDLKFETNVYIDIFKYIFINLDDNKYFLGNVCGCIQDYSPEFLDVFKKMLTTNHNQIRSTRAINLPAAVTSNAI